MTLKRLDGGEVTLEGALSIVREAKAIVQRLRDTTPPGGQIPDGALADIQRVVVPIESAENVVERRSEHAAFLLEFGRLHHYVTKHFRKPASQ
jgi:hypothetical protein